jgi:hypothetical protein
VRILIKQLLFFFGISGIQGLFESNTTSLNELSIKGGSLGYDSYKLLKKYYDIHPSDKDTKITFTNVKWSPYI